MPSKELIEKVAKAINGPFHPVPEGSPYTLDQLRDIQWMQINAVERKLCLASAQAAISTILAALQEPTPAMQLVVSANWGRRTWAEYQQVLAASALGEQSE
ncbi:hypothetical protein [Brucella tritici]|uniref:hypothetical protein n=1 Tax=Brucella tritici TaxID=94626 RepID=UPI002001648A|nr:hypothetical protein [Brucella tritici]